MKSIKTCPTCGHPREVDCCDSCGGTGVVFDPNNKPATPPYYTDGRFSFGPCKDCEGTGVKNGRMIAINASSGPAGCGG